MAARRAAKRKVKRIRKANQDNNQKKKQKNIRSENRIAGWKSKCAANKKRIQKKEITHRQSYRISKKIRLKKGESLYTKGKKILASAP